MITLLPTVLFACFCVSNMILGVPLKQHILVSRSPLPQEMKSKLKSVIQETLNDMEKATQNSKQASIHTSETLKDTEEIPLKKISSGPKTLRHTSELMNVMEDLLEDTGVSFIDSKLVSEKKDNKKKINQMTVKKTLIDEKERVNNAKETIEGKKKMLRNEGDALRKIDEIQKGSKSPKQTQNNLLDKMLIRIKKASIGENKTLDGAKEGYYPYHYGGPHYGVPHYGAYDHAYAGHHDPGTFSTHYVHTTYGQSRKKGELIGSTVAIILFCCAIFIGFALVSKSADNDRDDGWCGCCARMAGLYAFCKCLDCLALLA